MLKVKSIGSDVPTGFENATAALERITPEQAAQWLKEAAEYEKRTGEFNNRKMGTDRVNQHSRDIDRDDFIPSNDMITLDKDGIVFNGQHRLAACVQTGKDIWVFVARNMHRRSGEIDDQGKPRTQTEVLSFCKEKVTGSHGPVTRAMALGLSHGMRLTSSESVKFFRSHKAAVEFVLQHAGGATHCKRAMYRGALARAYYYVNEETLIRFMGVIKGTIDGTTHPTDSAAVCLRRFLMNHIGKSSSSYVLGAEIYGKTERAVQSVRDRQVMHQLRATKDELFPIKDPILEVMGLK